MRTQLQRRLPWFALFFLSLAMMSSVTAQAQTSLIKPNLALGRPASASSSFGPGQTAAQAVDGSTGTKWAAKYGQTSWLVVDLGQRVAIGRYRVIHANPFESWQQQSLNTRDFQFQVSNDKSHWTTVDRVTNNQANITDHPVSVSTLYRYVRLYITNPQTEPAYPTARIYELEVYAP